MTPSAQQPPTSAKAETGSDSSDNEETGAAVTAAASEPVPKREEADAEAPSEPGTSAAGVEAADPQSTNPDPEAAPDSERASGDVAAADGSTGSGTDPGAAAVAKSRLPAIVRTMTATAIDKPGTTAAVGRPNKAVLAGAAVAGALLVSVPFLVLGGDKDDNDRKETTAAGTVLGGDETEAPGAFSESTATPSTSASKDGKKDSGEKVAAGHDAASSATEHGRSTDEPKSGNDEKKDPAKSEAKQKPAGEKNTPAKAGNVTFSAPMALRSHLAGRCLDVPAANFSDGTKLMMWDCNNGPAQQWQFASDGTVRIHGLCLDVANADFTPGTPMQIARCSGNDAQKFVLNEAHDLVNTVVGKCVDIRGSNPDNKAPVQLWTCNGADAQKWSV